MSCHPFLYRFIESEDMRKTTSEDKTRVRERKYREKGIEHFENILSRAFENQNSLLDEIEYITYKEKLQLLEFNNTEASYPKHNTYIDVFKKRAYKTPNKIAVKYYDSQLTFKELDVLSDQFSNYLLAWFNNEIILSVSIL